MKKIKNSKKIGIAKEFVKKKNKRKKAISLKNKKIISFAAAGLVGASAISLATYGIYYSATKSKQIEYVIDKNFFTASDFHSNNAEQKFSEQINGAQKIITGTQGPVKFISNYTDLYGKEKISEFLSWFYHDVSWGPEISTLSSVKFLSGVLTDRGSTTLGYHTQARDGSTIIISPDVPFNAGKNNHIYQSIAYYLLNHYGKQETLTAFGLKGSVNDRLNYRNITTYFDQLQWQ